ncbi:ATP-binding protein [Comamonas terrigena]|uniref:ATP-binding protein n=1 Tax=Comamonas terrigena TaxID=32013 RepID=UPI002357775C|nr:ATP-binding protein [Comamonas terrigena]
MAIDFKCSDNSVELIYKGTPLLETSRKRKLQVGDSDFLEKFNGTKVEDIPKDISFFIDNIKDFYPTLHALSLDNSEKGMTILIMTDHINLGNWVKPFSFDEYISKLESLIEGLISPIKKYHGNGSAGLVNHTILGLKFFINHGDLLDAISNHRKNISHALEEAERLLSSQPLSSHTHLGRNLNFVEGEKCGFEEDLKSEFKEIKGENPVKSIQNLVDEYILAFFNSKGGSIYWGINDDGIVKSLNLTSKLKDEIRKAINNKINTIEPAIDPTQIGVFFHEVLNTEDQYVLEVSVPNSNSNRLYFNSTGETWVRLNGCKKKLCGSALQDYIIKRLQENP